MSEFDIPPRSIGDNIDAWTQARLGKVTASNIWKVLKRTQKGHSAEWTNYKLELICERLTGMRQDVFLNAAMQWGSETEPQAIRAYCERDSQNVYVPPQPFIDHPTIVNSGASPDGYVQGKEPVELSHGVKMLPFRGLVEAKCPLTRTHIETMLGGEIADKYIQQMQWQLACTGGEWCDFISYDPRLPQELRLFVKRVPRDPEMIASMEETVREFLAELEGDLKTLGSYTPVAPKQGDGRKEITGMGWSDNVPSEEFISVESLIAKGLVKRGL